MPLIRVVEGRQVLGRIKRDLAHVDARVGGGFRHRGGGQHPSPEKGGRDDERGSNQRKLTCHDPLLVIGCPFRSTAGVFSWPLGRSALAHRAGPALSAGGCVLRAANRAAPSEARSRASVGEGLTVKEPPYRREPPGRPSLRLGRL